MTVVYPPWFLNFSIAMLVFLAVMLIFTIYLIVRSRRHWRESEKKLRELANKRRAIFGLPPIKNYWDD